MTAVTTDADKIHALLNTYERSLNSADAELAASLYTDDAVFLPLFLPTASSAEIVESYRQIFDTIKLEVSFAIDDLTITGDVAHALTRSNGHVTVLSTGDTAAESNRELFVFTRANGDWKIARYIFNKTTAPGALAAAEERFADFSEEWKGVLSGDDRELGGQWNEFVPFLEFPIELRKIVYTTDTNAIESLNARFRHAVRHRGHFPNEQAAMKVLYLAASIRRPNRQDLVGKTAGWKQILNALRIHYADRLELDH